MVDYLIETSEGMSALRKFLKELTTSEQSFTLITRNEKPSATLKELFTHFLDDFEDVAEVNDTHWDIGLLTVVCSAPVILAVLENDTLLEHLCTISYDVPESTH